MLSLYINESNVDKTKLHTCLEANLRTIFPDALIHIDREDEPYEFILEHPDLNNNNINKTYTHFTSTIKSLAPMATISLSTTNRKNRLLVRSTNSIFETLEFEAMLPNTTATILSTDSYIVTTIVDESLSDDMLLYYKTFLNSEYLKLLASHYPSTPLAASSIPTIVGSKVIWLSPVPTLTNKDAIVVYIDGNSMEKFKKFINMYGLKYLDKGKGFMVIESDGKFTTMEVMNQVYG